VQVRVPEHREAAVKQLQAIIANSETENSIAHRALGWLAGEKKDPDSATEELKKAIEIKPDDPWARYYLAVLRFRNAKFNGQYFEGMANMMQDLRMVIDWDPDFASAYDMLAMARLEGGGTQSAMEAMRAAIKLNPRNENYLLNMARIYMAGKKWDAATQLLKQLSASADPQITHTARKSLDDLPTLEKYGILPVESDQEKAKADFAKEREKLAPPQLPDEHEAEVKEPPPPEPDKRPVKYLKGRLLRVDCGAAPAAVVTVSAGNRALKLRTENYKNLVLVGADGFSCEWKNTPVVVNYKAGGKADGDLVSLELH
jgi:tetratricopeptide (TPR) repeat protein